MKMRRIVKAGLIVLCAVMMLRVEKAYASETDEGTIVYEYGEVIEKNITTDIPVKPGTNYRVKVTYTGIDGEGKKLKPVRIYYEEVMYDQCVPNIQPAYKEDNADDRSGLLYEVTTPGVTDSREFTVAAIDEVLTVIVAGDTKLEKIEVTAEEPKQAGNKPTIYLIGDSLVQTYRSSYYPMTGWGQMLPEFFTKDVNIENRAIGGRSTLNFMNQGRLNDVLINVRPGDYVFITFGHNDGGGVKGRACSVADYKRYLKDYYVEGVRQRGGNPVLVTLGNQNIFTKNGEVIQSYPDYVNAMREAAKEKECPLIDLNEKSKAFFKAVYDKYGSQALKDIVFNCSRAGIYQNYLDGGGDSTHFQTYGATRLAEFVAEGVKELELPVISEYYVAPVKATAVPENVGTVKLDLKKYDKKYLHMDWKAVKGAEFYEIERASINAEGFVTDFEHLGYSAEGMFADPENYREVGTNYAYRVYAMNEAGRSEQPSAVCWDAVDKSVLEEFKGRLERGEVGTDVKEEPETMTGDDVETEVEEKSDTFDNGSDDIKDGDEENNSFGTVKAIVMILAAIVCAACVFFLVERKKGSKEKTDNVSDNK
jgi:lysophospholipase L1-like esterase